MACNCQKLGLQRFADLTPLGVLKPACRCCVLVCPGQPSSAMLFEAERRTDLICILFSNARSQNHTNKLSVMKPACSTCSGVFCPGQPSSAMLLMPFFGAWRRLTCPSIIANRKRLSNPDRQIKQITGDGCVLYLSVGNTETLAIGND